MTQNKAESDFEIIQTSEKAERSGQRQLWDRLDGESAKAYAAFCKYRDLSESRTLAKVAEMSHCSGQNINRWSRRWLWVNRAAAFDLVEEERQREQLCKDRMAMRRRQIQIGMAMQSVAVAGLREWQMKIEQGLPLNLRPDEIAQLVRVGSELERLGHGEEKDHRFTKIIVTIGTHTYEGEGEEEPVPDGGEIVN